MKNFILLPLIFIYSLTSYSQQAVELQTVENETESMDICGSWFWTSTDSNQNFEMEIVQINGVLRGSHCSTSNNGNFIDCSTGFSISLAQTDTNIFTGTIKSAYSNTTGKIKLIYNPSEKTVRFLMEEEPSGIYFLPKDIVLK